MASTYKVGPKPKAAKTEVEKAARKESHRRVDKINEGLDPDRGPRPKVIDAKVARMNRDNKITSRISSSNDSGSTSVTGKDNMVSRLGEQSFRIQKAKAGASNPAHFGKGSK